MKNSTIKPKEKACVGINKAKGVKGCGKETRYRTFGLCNDCLSDFLFETDAGKLIMEKRVIPKANVIVKKDKKRSDAKIRENITGVPELKKALEKIVNKICLRIDADCGCISCGGMTTPQAGHYHTVQSNGSIRYHLHNLNRQDYNCNCAKGGNINAYDNGLINVYGKTYWEYVKFEIVAQNALIQFRKPDLIIYIQKAKEFLKSIPENYRYSPPERIKAKNAANLFIGIYDPKYCVFEK